MQNWKPLNFFHLTWWKVYIFPIRLQQVLKIHIAWIFLQSFLYHEYYHKTNWIKQPDNIKLASPILIRANPFHIDDIFMSLKEGWEIFLHKFESEWKTAILRSLAENLFSKISQNSQENTCSENIF